MRLFYFVLLFLTVCAHTSNSMLPDLDVFDEDFNFYSQLYYLQNIRDQIKQTLHNKNNLDAPLNTLSRKPALHEALGKSELHDLVEPLLQAGADPNRKYELKQWAPLHYAATIKNNISYLHLLLKYKADVNVTNQDHETPLMFAVKFGNYEGARLLLKHGVNPNIQDKWEDTALQRACKDYLYKYKNNYTLRQNMVKLLLHHGANPFIQNYQGKTALDIAQENGFDDLAKLMENQKVRLARQLLIILNKAGVAADINIAQNIADFVYSSHV